MSYTFLSWTKKDRLLFTTQAAYAKDQETRQFAAPRHCGFPSWVILVRSWLPRMMAVQMGAATSNNRR